MQRQSDDHEPNGLPNVPISQDPLSTALHGIFGPLLGVVKNWPPVLAYGAVFAILIIVLVLFQLVVQASLIWLLGMVFLLALAAFVFTDLERQRSRSRRVEETEWFGLLGTRKSGDTIVDSVREELDRQYRDYLPINVLFRELRRLFIRNTFSEKIEKCKDKNWSDRLRAACLTKMVLLTYSANVAQRGTPEQNLLYEQLRNEVAGYCADMAAGLFEPPLTSADAERHMYNAEEFFKFLPNARSIHKLPREVMKDCDAHLERISELVNQLTPTDARVNG
jgi:Ca2+/Na+ antiporter